MSSDHRAGPRGRKGKRRAMSGAERSAGRARSADSPRNGGRARASSGPSIGLVATILAVVGGLVLVAIIAMSQGLGPGSGARTAGPGGSGGAGGSNAAGLVAPSAATPADLGDSPGQLGNPSAPVTVEVTEDFQCPICGQFARDYLPRLIDEFIRPGSVRLVTHDVEFLDRGDSTESLDSATAAACAGEQGRYWEYHDWLYANQHGENQGAFSRARLDAIADAVELDRTPFDACMTASTERSKVKALTDSTLAAGIHSTPTFVINGGQPIQGLPTYDALAGYLRSIVPAASPPAASTPAASAPAASGS